MPNGQKLKQTVFSVDDGISVDDIGIIYYGNDSSISTTVYDRKDYRARFNITSISDGATLIINKVTKREAGLTFQCKLVTVSNGGWAYKILLKKPSGRT